MANPDNNYSLKRKNKKKRIRNDAENRKNRNLNKQSSARKKKHLGKNRDSEKLLRDQSLLGSHR